MFACVALVLGGVQALSQMYAPQRSWRTSNPEAQGVDSQALVELLSYIHQHDLPVHDILIVRHGYLVFQSSFYPYRPQWPHDLASVTKSVTSMLTGVAVDQGVIKGPQQTVRSLLPQYFEKFDSPQRAAITVHDLLTMTSGFDCSLNGGEKALEDMQESSDWVAFALSLPLIEEPGTRFAYCSPNLHLLSAILTTQNHESELSFARKNLFVPLGIRDASWGADPQGRTTGWGGLHLKPADMAKLGYLFLHNSRWGAKQVISSAWTQASVEPQVAVRDGVAYGYNWWINEKHTPPIIEAEGRGGQRIVVIRDKDCVITILSGGVNTDELAPFFLKALESDRKLPPNPAARLHLAKLLVSVRQAPPPRRVLQSSGASDWPSGKTLLFEHNPIRLESVTFGALRGGSYTLGLALAGRVYTIPIGLHGRPDIAAGGPFGSPFAAQLLQSRNGKLILDLDTVANINHYVIEFTLTADHPTVLINELTGELHDYRLAARFQTNRASAISQQCSPCER